MGLESRTVMFHEEPITRLLGTSVNSSRELDILLQATAGEIHNPYFFGATLSAGTSEDVFFCQGPNHNLVEQIIREKTGSEEQICLCQISIGHNSGLINTILFLRDPGELSDNETISASDTKGIERRTQRMLAVAQSLSPNVCKSNIDIMWMYGDRYMYDPQEKRLFTSLAKSVTVK